MGKKRFSNFRTYELQCIATALVYYAESHQENNHFNDYIKMAKEATNEQIKKITKGETKIKEKKP